MPAHKKVKRVIRKRPAATKKLAHVVRKRPAAGLKTPAQKKLPCKPITEMTRKDFAFFQIPAGRGCFHMLQGCKSSRKGYLFQHLDFNTFNDKDYKIPANAKKKAVPNQKWLSEFFWDPAKRRLVPDAANMPERASGKAYRIEDNGGMPFVCYVRDDAASVFRRPRDGYVVDDDWTGDFEVDRLIYTEEVMTLDSPVKAWIGIDDAEQEHGNSILVHVSATKGQCLTVMIKLDETRQLLQLACTNLAGSEVFSIEVAVECHIATLAKKVADILHALRVKCVDENGKEVADDQPLREYSQLTLQDATHSYVYIGSDIYSFDCAEAVTTYYSIMGNNSVPYPVALTPTKVIFMMDQMEVPREQVAPHIVNENWGDAYSVFYFSKAKLTKTPLVNVKELSPRGG